MCRLLSMVAHGIMACTRLLYKGDLKPLHQLLPCAQGEWHCADCSAGRPAVSKHAPRNPRLLFVAAKLGMVKINKIWQLQDGTVQFRGRWYCRPEDTVDGRQVRRFSMWPIKLSEGSMPGVSRLYLSTVNRANKGSLRGLWYYSSKHTVDGSLVSGRAMLHPSAMSLSMPGVLELSFKGGYGGVAASCR